MVNGDPDLVWKLGADLVDVERRKQANHGIGDAGANGGHGSVFGRFSAGESVKSALDPLDGTCLDQLAELSKVIPRSAIWLGRKKTPRPASEAGLCQVE